MEQEEIEFKLLRLEERHQKFMSECEKEFAEIYEVLRRTDGRLFPVAEMESRLQDLAARVRALEKNDAD